ncbi:MAG: YitT family protein [Clostridiaceae bacterium]|nr:YitT family protein [Clostridiaceae bacterium]
MKKLREYLVITIGVLAVSFGLEYFFFSNKIASGGVSGLALVLHDIFNIDSGIVLLICNVILFIVAFVFIGGSFGLKSIYATFAVSLILTLVEALDIVFPITNNLMLASIFGSVMLAWGSAMIFSQGASTGGTSIIAKILNKYAAIEIGKAMLISDSVVIILAIYTYGMELGLFGLLSVFFTGTLVDKFIDGFKSCKEVAIFTKQEELVVNYIMKDVDRGCTVFYGKGGYTGENNTVIYAVMNRKQFIKLKSFIKEKDPDAFITVREATEVFGVGFSNIIEG